MWNKIFDKKYVIVCIYTEPEYCDNFSKTRKKIKRKGLSCKKMYC